MPYLTPDTLPPVKICRRLSIPDDIRIVAAVSGALHELSKSHNWESFGAQTPEDTAYAMLLMLQDYFHSEGCMIGAMMPYAGLNPPSGSLPCDGETYNRVDYPELYAYLVGSPYIVDADIFTTPIFPGRAVVQPSEEIAVYSEFGEVEHALTIDELTPHSHTSPPHSHSEITATPTTIPPGEIPVPLPSAVPGVGTTGAAAVSIDSTGGGEAFPLYQPSVAFNWCIVSGRIVAVVPPVPEIETFFGNGVPDFDTETTTDPGNLGIRFRASVDGVVTGVRFYRRPAASNGHIGYIFSDTGALLRTASFPDDVLGWNTAEFLSPLPVVAGIEYVAAIYAPDAHYIYTLNYFTSDVTVGNLTAPADGADGEPNGRFNVASAGVFPTFGFSAINFFIDIEFVAD